MSREEIISAVDRSWNAWTAALDGIPEELTGESGVCGYFSIKDLVGHIAFWDEQDLERAQKLARGEAVQPNDWATMNDQEYEAHRDDTLEAQTARMIDAHARLASNLRTLDRIDDLQLSDTWEHYDDHRQDVLAWRAGKGIPTRNQQILARIEAEWQQFLPALDGLTEEQASQPGVAGYYSVNDLVAHLAWWENQTREVVETGNDPEIDVEALNDEIFAANRTATFAELRQRLIDGHARAVATFAAAPHLTEDDVKDDTWEHFADHGNQIRAWRALNSI